MPSKLSANKATTNLETKRLFVQVNGIVQGVGFRPFVYTLAKETDLSGFISNSNRGVEIELQGSSENLDTFLDTLKENPPPLAEISEIRITSIELRNESGFEIQKSEQSGGNQTLISPDMSICPDCLTELFDKNDRRFLYPFINCTNCGPRFTIIKGIPYDRPFTSMSNFPLCPECKEEYENPLNRRFHAQPNACPVCGPKVWLETQQNKIAEENDTFIKAVQLIKEGKILAVKGLGGFHLVVDACNEEAVKRLRARKNREEKPLALMVPDLETAKRISQISLAEEKLLQSPQRPIVLIKRLETPQIAYSIAPGNHRLGIMLPYTPLHYILFKYWQEALPPDAIPALVFTSANLSEEPIVIDNQEAKDRLKNIADAYLMHNRDILVRTDDSVVMQLDENTQIMRRSRGYAPKALITNKDAPEILAIGAELKNTITIAKDNRLFMSQYIGDLENISANNFFREAVNRFQDILTCNPQIIVHDMHPSYFSTQWAQEQQNVKLIAVQHHHAHMAACMAEHQLNEPVIGLILDGTGYGYDKTVWGGELFVGDYLNLERCAWMEPMPIPGGEAAIKNPWRLALAYLHQTFKENLPELEVLKDKPLQLIQQMIETNLNTPFSSSCGRLFDAIAAMINIRQEVHYEAQAAIEMMQLVKNLEIQAYPIEAEMPVIPIRQIVRSVVNDLLSGQSKEIIAARFHKTLIELFAQLIIKLSKQTSITKAVLSGGVFQNEVLLSGLLKRLSQTNIKCYTQHLYPVNDGSISLGQAVIARELIMAEQEEVEFKTV